MMKKSMMVGMVAMMVMSTPVYANNITNTGEEIVENYEDFCNCIEIVCDEFEEAEENVEITNVITREASYGYETEIEYTDISRNIDCKVVGSFNKKGDKIFAALFVDGELYIIEFSND